VFCRLLLSLSLLLSHLVGCAGIREVGFYFKPLPYSDKPDRACQDASLATARAVNVVAHANFKDCFSQRRLFLLTHVALNPVLSCQHGSRGEVATLLPARRRRRRGIPPKARGKIETFLHVLVVVGWNSSGGAGGISGGGVLGGEGKITWRS
jgi:hypothetical protein